MTKPDVVIVGGGPAGAIAACRLADGGRRVVLIEREHGAHHKVCGEFVSIEARHYLASVGIDADAMGASSITNFRLIHGGNVVTTPLPFEAIGLSRKVIDEKLLEAAEERGVSVLRGRSVRAMNPQGDILRIETSEGALTAPAVILATGKHDLRGNPRPIGERDDFIGLKTLLAASPSQTRTLAGFVEIILFEGGYAGLQLVDGATVNLCLVVRRDLFSKLENDWQRLLNHIASQCPRLAQRLAGATSLFPKPLAIYRIPYGFLHSPCPTQSPRIYRVGDQAAVIPSFCGDGVSIALHTGALAAEAILGGADAHGHHARLQRDLGGQMRSARMIAALGEQPLGRGLLMTGARLFPGLLRIAASTTRVAL